MATPCDCPSGVDGVPQQWKVSIAGVTNGSTCSTCANFNGDYILDRVAQSGCVWQTTFTAVCDYNKIKLTLDSGSITVEITNTGSPLPVVNPVTWVNNAIEDGLSPATLSVSLNPAACTWPSTISVMPVAPALSAASQYQNCVPGLQAGCGLGTLMKPVRAPWLGGATATAMPVPTCSACGGCAASGCRCGGGGVGDGEEVFKPKRRSMSLDAGCFEGLGDDCGVAGPPEFSDIVCRAKASIFSGCNSHPARGRSSR